MRIAAEVLLDVLNAVLQTLGVLLVTSSFCAKSDKKSKHKPARGSNVDGESKKQDGSSKGSSASDTSASASTPNAAEESDKENKKKPNSDQKSKSNAPEENLAPNNKSAKEAKTQKSIESQRNVIDEKPKTNVAAVEPKELDVRSGDLVLSVVNPSPVDYSSLPAWILERIEGKTQEVLPEDEKPPDRPVQAVIPSKAGVSPAKDQQYPPKASNVPAIPRKPVYKAKKPGEYVAVFAGSLAPKAAVLAAQSTPAAATGTTVKLPMAAGLTQPGAVAKESPKVAPVGMTTKLPVASAANMKLPTFAKQSPKPTLAPSTPPGGAVKPPGPGTTVLPLTALKPPSATPAPVMPTASPKLPVAGAKPLAVIPPPQQPSQPAAPAPPGKPPPAPAPGPPSKIPSDCVRV